MPAPEAGSYTYRAIITDSRGHETVLKDELVFGEPEPFEIEQRLYVSNSLMREPLEVNISPVLAVAIPATTSTDMSLR